MSHLVPHPLFDAATRFQTCSAGNISLHLPACQPACQGRAEDTVRFPAAQDEALLQALEASTGTAWRWAGGILAVERRPPYRVVVLRSAALGAWRAWRDTPAPHECQLSLEVFKPIETPDEEEAQR